MAFENFERKGQNAGNQYFLLFPHSFPHIEDQTNFVILDSFKMSANAFNLDRMKVLWFGKKLKTKFYIQHPISSLFIFQRRKYPCNIAHDIFFYIPRIFLEQKLISH